MIKNNKKHVKNNDKNDDKNGDKYTIKNPVFSSPQAKILKIKRNFLIF